MPKNCIKEKIKREMFLRDEIANIIFTDESLRDYVVTFISKVLEIDKEAIKDNLELLSDRVNNNIDTINSEVDSIYKTDCFYINIEINMQNGHNLQKKNFRYISHTYLRNMQKSDEGSFRNVRQININNFDYFKKDDFIYKSSLIEEKYHLKRNDYLTIYDINVDFLRKLDYNKVNEEADDSLIKLLYIFVCEDNSLRDKLYRKNKIMAKVNNKLNELTSDFDSLLYYDKEEILREDSFDAGLEKGKKEKAIVIAKKMLQLNEPLEKIVAITELSQDEILKLEKETGN